MFIYTCNVNKLCFLFTLVVCKLLEQEKLEHTDLKRTWQMANDQFLESQRLMVMDMRRVESVLSAEQQRRITGRACYRLTSWISGRTCGQTSWMTR